MKIQNRLFQKGDKVRFINQGRILPPRFDYDKTYTVTQKETETGVVSVDNIDFSSVWLELVEPVEKNYPLKCIICGKSCEHIETNAKASFFMRFVLTANL